jgi:hypothetical protein
MAAIAATGVSVGLASVAASTAQAAPVHPAAAHRAAAPVPAGTSYSTNGGLLGVAAAASNDAWAVGYAGRNSSPKILILHWNGSAWSRVTRPSVLESAGQLSAITVVNSRDAWAAGFTGNPLKTIHSLLLHWNGTTWSQVTSPAPVKDGALSAVTATTKGGFAVGYYFTGPSAVDYWTLSFRLAGSKWSRVAARTDNAGFEGVATTSATTTWATANAVGMLTGGLARWNGKGWTWTSFPVEGQYHALYGIAAGPGGTAFAVGANGNFPSSPPLSMKWTGRKWEKVTVSAPKGGGLNTVTFAPGGTAWAAGSTSLAAQHTLIVRWSGRKWARVASPNDGPETDLYGIGFSAAKYGWAVGYSFSSSGTAKTVILHWNGRSWS